MFHNKKTLVKPNLLVRKKKDKNMEVLCLLVVLFLLIYLIDRKKIVPHQRGTINPINILT